MSKHLNLAFIARVWHIATIDLIIMVATSNVVLSHHNGPSQIVIPSACDCPLRRLAPNPGSLVGGGESEPGFEAMRRYNIGQTLETSYKPCHTDPQD